LDAIKKNEVEFTSLANEVATYRNYSLYTQTAVDVSVVLLETLLTGGTLAAVHWTTDKVVDVASKRLASKIGRRSAQLAREAFRETAEEGVTSLVSKAIAADKAWQNRARDYLLSQARLKVRRQILKKGWQDKGTEFFAELFGKAEKEALSRFERAVAAHGARARDQIIARYRDQAKAWARQELRSYERLSRFGKLDKALIDSGVIKADKMLAAAGMKAGADQLLQSQHAAVNAAKNVLLSDAIEVAFDRGIRTAATGAAKKLGEGSLKSVLGTIGYENLGDFKKFTPADGLAIAGALTKAAAAYYFESKAQEAERKLLKANLQGGTLFSMLQLNQVARHVYQAERDSLSLQLAYQQGRREGLQSGQRLKRSRDEQLSGFPAQVSLRLSFSTFVPPPKVTLGGVTAELEGGKAPPEGRDSYSYRVALEAPEGEAEEAPLVVELMDLDGRGLDSDPTLAPVMNLAGTRFDHYEAGPDKQHRLLIGLGENQVRVRFEKASAVKEIR
jgi:hypothetical protein